MADPDPYAGSFDEDAGSPEPQPQPQPTKNYRGRTWMNSLNRRRSSGALIPVDYNEYGQVCGPNRAMFKSHLGATVRGNVSCTIASWNDVGKEVHNRIWDIMTVYFLFNGC